ncbi:MAG: histidinol-phosphate transaminase [Coriobacteriales bacterium]
MRRSKMVEGMSPYDPKYIPAKVLLSANENPDDVPAKVRKQILERISEVGFNRYPAPAADKLRDAISENLPKLVLPTLEDHVRDSIGFPEFGRDNIVLGNGGDELLFNTFMLFGGPGNKVLLVPPSFSVYDIDAGLTSTEVVNVPRNPDFSIDEDAVIARASKEDVNLVVITSPNNPTGDCADVQFVRKLLESTDAIVLLDEAYAEFSERTCIPLIAEYPNLCILRTFSKAYSLAGVRLGYIVANPEVISSYLMVRQPYSVDAVSQVIGQTVVENCLEYRNVVRSIIVRREELYSKLDCINGVEVFPSKSNFMTVRVKGAGKVWEAMAYEDSVLVRDFSRQRYLENCLRITVGTEEENEKMLNSLASNIVRGM